MRHEYIHVRTDIDLHRDKGEYECEWTTEPASQDRYSIVPDQQLVSRASRIFRDELRRKICLVSYARFPLRLPECWQSQWKHCVLKRHNLSCDLYA